MTPTILEAAGIPHPETVNGVAQRPIEGTSLLYSLNDAGAPDRHTTQYFEMFGNRGIWHEGWTAAASHRIPWEIGQVLELSFDDDTWELYDTRSDWAQAHDVAAEHPEKLAELKELFVAEAGRHQVLPLDDRGMERMVGERMAPRSVVLHGGDGLLRPGNLPLLHNTSYVLSADIEVVDGADGVVVASGGRFGGWSLHLVEGRPTHAYNFLGLGESVVEGAPLVAGRHRVDYRFAYDGGGFGQGGVGSLWVDGVEQASVRIERTAPFLFSIDETLNVGIDRGSPVSVDYRHGRGNPLHGTVHTVTITSGGGVQPSEQERLASALVSH
ncbi:hypothetical protein [Nocardioides alcanivorans]|uniref:hypothetical protein n=1 Tax=Nocardioides alcanivorans TaxID=2897352 RepID=UPI001F412547|nr:hypothetical protein [Nocardioides alcanivorans]